MPKYYKVPAGAEYLILGSEFGYSKMEAISYNGMLLIPFENSQNQSYSSVHEILITLEVVEVPDETN